ncbi:MAG: tRNA (adenosine(37)-N6)-dimethylallyltransferase MiaA [Deltaproteobacteria bacterium]|nr:tRNA (adenosine(37)-N6)-dimethylallyltransferase MiaA [Deltaproteobacteria bacterium]
MNSTIKKPKIIIICGPTGIGKTSVAIKIAETFNGEIISADSMQIYRHMDIGTAKPAPAELARARHHMIDIVNPDEHFDAALFSGIAHKKVLKLDKRRIVPIVAGGTGLYIKALIHGLFGADPADPNIRIKLKEEADAHGADFLYKRLAESDPAAAERIHPNDTYRIIRALELAEATGKTISKHHGEHRFADKRYKVLKIGLQIEREALYDRINQRVDVMIEAGLVDEVRGLLERGYSGDLKSMQSIGYRHMVDYIKGRVLLDETIRTLKRDTRRYAKRQMTWFNADPKIVWTKPEETEDIMLRVKDFLQL